MPKVLFVTSEAQPLIKTGGLGDVSASLPAALQALGTDVRLLLPAYRPLKERLGDHRPFGTLSLQGYDRPVTLLKARMPDSGVPLYLIDAPELFDRDGGPYGDTAGHDWPDNALRFATFCRAAVELAMGRAGLDWRPDIVHSNDWQSALVPALLSLEKGRPANLFTIHNLAYQGLFPASTFSALKLPLPLWSMHGLEYYGKLNFIKGGLAYADRITTVSQTYAGEIQHPAHGYGLDGLLSHRRDVLSGILNGVDYTVWDPRTDPLIPHHYDAGQMTGKQRNKAALQQRLGLEASPDTPLLGLISRLVEQKGVDLLLDVLPPLLERGEAQLALLGSGERRFEKAFRTLAERYPKQAAVVIGYDETLAHIIEAGADMFLMPSRFEPCGLNQLYSLHYGTPPIVHRTGGLADTVVHADNDTLQAGTANGFVFEHADATGLRWAIEQAIDLFRQPHKWQQIQNNGMAQDFSWQGSAARYLALYDEAVAELSSRD